MIIDKDTLKRMRYIRAEYELSNLERELFIGHTPEEVDTRVMEKVAHQLHNAIHDRCGKCIDLEDVTVTVESATNGASRRFTATWEPESQEIEIRGGALDGRLMAYHLAPSGLKVIVYAPEVQNPDGSWPSRLPSDKVVTFEEDFEMVAWDTERRVWLYSASTVTQP